MPLLAVTYVLANRVCVTVRSSVCYVMIIKDFHGAKSCREKLFLGAHIDAHERSTHRHIQVSSVLLSVGPH